MCLAIPAQVIEVDGNEAQVQVGGICRQVRLELIEDDIFVGDYVLLHSGFAIQKMDKDQAQDSLDTWRELLDDTK